MNCEDYVISKLEELEKENKKLKNRISELEDKPVDVDNFTIIDKDGSYYHITWNGYYHFNDFLKANDKGSDFLKECLEDNDRLDEFLELKDNSSWNDRVSRLYEEHYDYMFEGYQKEDISKSRFVVEYKNGTNIHMVDVLETEYEYFTNRDMAMMWLRENVRYEIGEYFKSGQDKKLEVKDETN